ncbi:MAG: hypothetical protein JWP02_2120 [Acidimicrobiales bacterium]|nr:hypothetical protein [Acidimicrobiales bacterium]
MAAIAYPSPRRRPDGRPHLTLVPPPARRRRRPAIYWRRRALVLVVLVLVVLAARAALGVLGGGPLAAPGAPAGRSGPGAVYVVQTGDTWWSIARHLQPTGDVRALVDSLAAGHRGATLQAGERLSLR